MGKGIPILGVPENSIEESTGHCSPKITCRILKHPLQGLEAKRLTGADGSIPQLHDVWVV